MSDHLSLMERVKRDLEDIADKDFIKKIDEIIEASIAKAAYLAYQEKRDLGQVPWDDLDELAQQAWHAAVEKVREFA